ncbi:MAG: hypothetical protein QW650_00455 [Thermofilum sp.]
MAGRAIVGTYKKIVLDTKRNIFGLTDVTLTLRFGDKKKTIQMVEVIDQSVQPLEGIVLSANAPAGSYHIVVNDASGIKPNDVLKIGNEYVVVKAVDTSTKTISLRYRLKQTHASGEEVERVGNTGFYEASWFVDLNDPDLGPLSIGDTILVDISSVSGGFLFEGQLITIEDNTFAKLNTIDSKIDEIRDMVDGMIGYSDDDRSRVLV